MEDWEKNESWEEKLEFPILKLTAISFSFEVAETRLLQRAYNFDVFSISSARSKVVGRNFSFRPSPL